MPEFGKQPGRLVTREVRLVDKRLGSFIKARNWQRYGRWLLSVRFSGSNPQSGETVKVKRKDGSETAVVIGTVLHRPRLDKQGYRYITAGIGERG